MTSRRRARLIMALPLLAAAGCMPATSASSSSSHASASTTSPASSPSSTSSASVTALTAKAVSRSVLHVDFGPRTTKPPHGYLLDYGLGFSAARGYGWEKASNGKAFSLVGNGVRRSSKLADPRYLTLIQMQAGRAKTTPAQWQAALHNGVYRIRVAVGDATSHHSVNVITAQPGTKNRVVLVGGFKPTAAHPFFTVTKKVRVTNGRLTLSPRGGKNTTIDFVIATPVPVKPAPPPSAIVVNLAAGGTVTAGCHVTGFTGVLANSAGTQCDASKISFVPGGLRLVSTSGQLANDNQQNALYRNFNASKDFTVKTRIAGPINQLTTNYQQEGAFFGPDQNNFVKVEAEHNGPGAPHMTMFYRENGVAGVVGTVAVPALTSAGTLDVTIQARSHQLTVFYSINGGPQTQVGTTKSPANVGAWFSTAGKTGVLVSNSGSPTSITAIVNRLTISWP